MPLGPINTRQQEAPSSGEAWSHDNRIKQFLGGPNGHFRKQTARSQLQKLVHYAFAIMGAMSGQTPLHSLIAESRAAETVGNISVAIQKARDAMQQAEADGNPATLAEACVTLARAHFHLGHYAEARNLSLRVLSQRLPNSLAQAEALLMMGNCAAETDSLDEAEAFYHQAVDLARETGDHRVRMIALHNLSAAVYLPRGQFDLALGSDEQAAHVAREHNLSELLYLPLITTAWAHQLQGQRLQARSFLDELARMAAPGSLAEGYLAFLSACVAQDEGDLVQALAHYSRARVIAEAIGEPGLNVEVRLGVSRQRRLSDENASALSWANDAWQIAARVGYCHLQGKALIECGRNAWLCGELPRAEANLRRAIEILMPLRADPDLARASLLLAAFLHSQGRAEAMSVWLDAATRLTSRGYVCLLDQERALAFPLLSAYLTDPDTAAVSGAVLAYLQRVPPVALRILALGKFEVWQGTRRIDRHALSHRRADELLGLLLVSAGHTLSRDQVIEALWPGQEPGAVQARLNHATSALRRALEPDLPDKFPSRYLDSALGRVNLELPPGSSFDADLFERQVKQRQWSEAVKLYGGELFPNASQSDWSVAPRERLTQLFLRALFELAQAGMQAGCPGETVELCRQILDLEPWHEPAVLLGMQACQAQNDRAGALRLYRKLAAALAHDLGAEPQADLQALYQLLTSQAASRHKK